MSDVKKDRTYTKDHEWAKTEGGEVLIPMAEAFIRQVDLEHGRIVAVSPEMADAKP